MAISLIKRLTGAERKVTTGDRHFDILCISGVGALAIFAAQVLQLMEEEADEPIARRFHLISGTSVGAFLALALAREYPAADLVTLLKQRSFQVWSRPEGQGSGLGSMALLEPRSDASAWKSLMMAALGEETAFKEIMHPVLVPAYDVTIGRPRLFGAPFSLSGYGQQDMRIIDIAMAATATPALLPVAKIEETRFVDGVVISPSPDTIVLREAIHHLDADIETIRMVSIGTLTGRFRMPKGLGTKLGLLPWASEGKLQALTMAAQNQVSCDLMRDLLGDRYCRIDEITTGERGLPHPLTADRHDLERAQEAAHYSWQRVRRGETPGHGVLASILPAP